MDRTHHRDRTAFANSDRLPFSVDFYFARRRKRHEIQLQLRTVDLIESSIGNKQSVASKQRLHSSVDQCLIGLMVVVSSRRLLAATSGGKDNKNDKPE